MKATCVVTYITHSTYIAFRPTIQVVSPSYVILTEYVCDRQNSLQELFL